MANITEQNLLKNNSLADPRSDVRYPTSNTSRIKAI